MKKLVSLLLVLMLVFACVAMMASCGGDEPGGNNEPGPGGNGEGGGGGGGGGKTPPTVVPGETVESDVDCVNPAWTSKETLIMSVNDCSDKNVIQSGGRAYVAGNNKYTSESAHIENSLLKDVIQRNSD